MIPRRRGEDGTGRRSKLDTRETGRADVDGRGPEIGVTAVRASKPGQVGIALLPDIHPMVVGATVSGRTACVAKSSFTIAMRLKGFVD